VSGPPSPEPHAGAQSAHGELREQPTHLQCCALALARRSAPLCSLFAPHWVPQPFYTRRVIEGPPQRFFAVHCRLNPHASDDSLHDHQAKHKAKARIETGSAKHRYFLEGTTNAVTAARAVH
jgi:hypothetical protein